MHLQISQLPTRHLLVQIQSNTPKNLCPLLWTSWIRSLAMLSGLGVHLTSVHQWLWHALPVLVQPNTILGKSCSIDDRDGYEGSSWNGHQISTRHSSSVAWSHSQARHKGFFHSQLLLALSDLGWWTTRPRNRCSCSVVAPPYSNRNPSSNGIQSAGAENGCREVSTLSSRYCGLWTLEG